MALLICAGHCFRQIGILWHIEEFGVCHQQTELQGQHLKSSNGHHSHGGLSQTYDIYPPTICFDVCIGSYISFLGALSSDTGSWCTPQFIKGDLQSGDLLNYILRRENVDTVMHFAAQVREGALMVYVKIRDCLGRP